MTGRATRQNIDIQHALSFVPADDRETWLKMGMAVKVELGDEGFGLWDHWSQSASTYSERDARSVWRSFKGSGVSIGSLIYEAQQYGWQQDSSYIPKSIPIKPAPKPQSSTFDYAKRLWLASDWKNVSSHVYAKAKGIDWPAGAARGIASGRVVGQNADCIIVPIRDLNTNKVMAVQCINSRGAKQTFGQLSGNAFICGNTLDQSIRWFVVEGWADAVSMVFHHCDGNAVAMAACGKGSMKKLASRVAEVFAPDSVTVLEDAA